MISRTRGLIILSLGSEGFWATLDMISSTGVIGSTCMFLQSDRFFVFGRLVAD